MSPMHCPAQGIIQPKICKMFVFTPLRNLGLTGGKAFHGMVLNSGQSTEKGLP
jgi:hypothetical protein